jgi:hypothetical protein
MSLGLRTTGRATKPIGYDILGELTEEDLESLTKERGTQPPAVMVMRERHHALAKSIASGVKPGDAAHIHRYSASRVSILLGDPAFQELVEHYRGLADEQYVDFHAKLGQLAVDASHLLQERMEDPEQAVDISTGQLLQIITAGADRTGFGPTQKTEVNHKIGLADKLADARNRILQDRSAAMRDVTPTEE